MSSRLCVALSLITLTHNVGYSAPPNISIAQSSEEADAFIKTDVSPTSRVFVSNLLSAQKGTVFSLAKELPAGRYRLHAQVSVSPLGHALIEDLDFSLSTGRTRGEWAAFILGRSDAWRHVSLEFAHAGGRANLALHWTVGSLSLEARAQAAAKEAARSRPKVIDIQFDEEVDPGDEFEVEEVSTDGMCSFQDTKAVSYRLASKLPVLERLSPIAVTLVQPDKLLYQPGDSGNIQLVAKNFGPDAASATIKVSIVRSLSDQTLLVVEKVQIAGQGEHKATVPFVASGKFGHSIRAEVITDQGTEIFEDYFGVADNFFDVGIGGTQYPIFSDRKVKLDELVTNGRRDYANWFDVFFWAPCDWSLHISPLENWWSGQTSYRHNEKNLKAFIDECHSHGIRVASYASSNPAGPFGWETARRRPDWFLDSNGRLPLLTKTEIEALDHWNDPRWREGRGHPGWFRLLVDLRRLDALDFGIDQIIAGAKHYGWDAVRFDGHYTIRGHDELSTRNMRRLKERVGASLPDFRFGFNYGRAPDFHGGISHEMREAMAGGGLYMQEGIRAWRYTSLQYHHWKHYATQELATAKTIQRLGGSYHCIYDLARTPSPQATYKLVLGLIAGAHPAYGDYASTAGCTNWGAFMTRWSGLLWDRALKSDPDAVQRIKVASDSVFWKPLVQSRVVSKTKKFLVIHLVNLPLADAIAETSPTPSIRDVRVVIESAPNEKILNTYCIQPQTHRAGIGSRPWVVNRGATTGLTISDLHLWGMVIVELEGDFELPASAPRLTEPPDAAKVAEGMKGSVRSRIVDPNKTAISLDTDPNERIWETDSGFSGIPGLIESDPDATGGLAQMKTHAFATSGHSQRFMGRTWLGPLTPGKYRLSYRIKWHAGDSNRAWKAHAYINVVEGDRTAAKQDLVSANCIEDKTGKFKEFANANLLNRAVPLTLPDKYQDYPLEFEIADTGYIHANMIVDTDGPGNQRLFLDHIKTDLIEPFTDDQLAKRHPIAKPDGLRTPQGNSPKKLLLIKGLFSDTYGVKKHLTCDSSYDLPSEYAALYTYDTILFANVNMTFSTHKARRMLRDFVSDGGRLVFLGGISTYANGGFRHTYLEQLVPLDFRNGGVQQLREPEALGFRRNVSSVDEPAVYWVHKERFKEEASVLAFAGDMPVAAEWKVDKGTVASFTGTVLGDNAASVPFWKTSTWAELLRTLSGAQAR